MDEKPVVTIYTCLDSFDGPRGRIQRNAVGSWVRLRGAEVLLFGKGEPGAEAFAAEVGLPVYPVDRNENGTPMLRSILAGGEAQARSDVLCFVNSDMIILPVFLDALEAALATFDTFLLSTRRWDMASDLEVDFGDDSWAESVRRQAEGSGGLHRPTGIDVFCYKGIRYADREPGFLYARSRFDNWLVWRALEDGVPFLDGRTGLIHQKHPRSSRRYIEREHPERVHNRAVYDRENGGLRVNFSHTCYHLEDGRWKRDYYGRTRGWERV